MKFSDWIWFWRHVRRNVAIVAESERRTARELEAIARDYAALPIRKITREESWRARECPSFAGTWDYPKSVKPLPGEIGRGMWKGEACRLVCDEGIR